MPLLLSPHAGMGGSQTSTSKTGLSPVRTIGALSMTPAAASLIIKRANRISGVDSLIDILCESENGMSIWVQAASILKAHVQRDGSKLDLRLGFAVSGCWGLGADFKRGNAAVNHSMMHARTNARTPARTRTRCALTHTTHTHTHTHTRAHTDTHTRARARTHTHTHTHTHAHTQIHPSHTHTGPAGQTRWCSPWAAT